MPRTRRSLLWLRRDLRRADHPALAAAGAGGAVLPVFVLDPAFLDPAGPVRRGWLAATLRALDAAYDGHLCLRLGDPREVIPALAAEVGAAEVHVSQESEPAGAARDAEVRDRLATVTAPLNGKGTVPGTETDPGLNGKGTVPGGVGWVVTGSPYAVTPGRVRNRAGSGFSVFTPFLRAWREHGWRAPAVEPDGVDFLRAPSQPQAWALVDRALADCPVPLPPAGEAAALERWAEFLAEGLEHYAEHRDRPDLAGTSQLSPYLKFGVIHPRTLLADLTGRAGAGAERFVAELAWREFYADVLQRRPDSLSGDLHPLHLPCDDPGAGFDAWCKGRTGFPFVDAGMRQLLATGWMHNRVRMVSASFLVKDLHVWWPHGAAHFLKHLIDGDLASNTHGWQWVAGTGTDAAPYFRVFNPVSQGERFDPAGEYVRRWVPELAHLPGPAAHRPWDAPDGYARGYPPPIVDHAAERLDALDRYRQARADTLGG